MATAPQAPMEMPQQGANPFADPNTMAVYDQMRQTVSPKEFGDQMLAGAEQTDPQEVAKFRSALEQIQMPPEALDLLNNMVDEILANPEQYDQIRAKYKEMGAPDEILPEQFDPQFFAALNMAVDQMIGAPAGAQAFAKGGIAELTPVSKAIADYGRNGDTMLAHITPAEARMLRRKGGSGTINPKTGLPEYFNLFKEIGNAFKAVGNAVKSFASSTVGRIVTTVALGFFLGPAAASFLGATSTAAIAAVSGFVGSASSTLLAGGNIGDALKAGAIGGFTAGATAGFVAPDAFSAGLETTPGQAFQTQLDKVGNVFSTPTTAAPTQIPTETSSLSSQPYPAVRPDEFGMDAKTYANTPAVDNRAFAETPPGANEQVYKAPQATTAIPAATPATAPPQGFDYAENNPLLSPEQRTAGLSAEPTRTFGPAPAGPSMMPAAPTTVGAPNAPTVSGIAPPSTPTVGQAFRTIGEGLGIGEGNSFNADTLMKGAGELFSPGPSSAEVTARAKDILTSDTTGKMTYSDALRAANAEGPGMLRSYGPATLAGLGSIGLMGGFTPKPIQESYQSKMLKGGPGSAEALMKENPYRFYIQGLPGVTYYNGSTRPPGMATGGIVDTLPPGINPDGSWNKEDYLARHVSGQIDTQAQVDAARAAALADLNSHRIGQSVTDASGKVVPLSAWMEGFDASNPTAQTYLGELAWRGGDDSTSRAFNESSSGTEAAKAANTAAWQKEWQRLNALDIANKREGANLSGIMPASAQQALDTRKNVGMFSGGGIADAMQYAIGGGVDKQLYDAYTAGDTAKVNQIIKANNVTADEIQTRFNLTPADMAYIDNQAGVDFAAPVTNTGGSGGGATVNSQGVAYSAADTAMYNAFRAGDYNLLNGLLATYNTTPAYLKTKFGLTDADISWITGQGAKFGTVTPLKTTTTGSGTTVFSDSPGFNLAASGVKAMPKTTAGGTQMGTPTGIFPAVDDLQLAAGMDANGITPQKMAVAAGLGLPEVTTRYWNAKNEAILGNYKVDPATGTRTPIAARAPVTQTYNNANALTSGLSPTGPLGEYSTRAVTPVVPDKVTGGITTIPNVNYTLPGVQRAMPLFASDVKLGSYRDPNTATQYTPLEQRLYDAFRGNDTAQLNNLLSQNNVSAGAVQNRFGLSPADTASMAQNGVNFFTPPAANTGTATKLMNTGGIAGLAQGGYPRRNGQIDGPGTETSDSIPAMLSDGEFVMTAKAVRGAGKGDKRAGAKRMYALMHQLEQNAARG